MADALRELSEYEYMVECRKYEKQDNGEHEYRWKEVAICKTFEQAASLMPMTTLN